MGRHGLRTFWKWSSGCSSIMDEKESAKLLAESEYGVGLL